MPTMWLTDMQKVGVVFCSAGRLAMGNILFLIGLTLIIGLQKTLAFFARRQKLKGTAAFLTGICLILFFRWPLTGFLVELYGIFVLFGDFFFTVGQFAGNVPIVGPYLRVGMEKIGVVAAAASGGSSGGNRGAELPV
ncbi:Golgi Transport [Arachnomyces sp. PD_36]|nr:Golgi Transport [Arachnomyces sp. PD_36]